MLVGAKVCDLTEDFLWFVCGLYVGISTSSHKCLTKRHNSYKILRLRFGLVVGFELGPRAFFGYQHVGIGKGRHQNSQAAALNYHSLPGPT